MFSSFSTNSRNMIILPATISRNIKICKKISIVYLCLCSMLSIYLLRFPLLILAGNSKGFLPSGCCTLSCMIPSSAISHVFLSISYSNLESITLATQAINNSVSFTASEPVGVTDSLCL